jgi:hypothetical protein
MRGPRNRPGTRKLCPSSKEAENGAPRVSGRCKQRPTVRSGRRADWVKGADDSAVGSSLRLINLPSRPIARPARVVKIMTTLSIGSPAVWRFAPCGAVSGDLDAARLWRSNCCVFRPLAIFSRSAMFVQFQSSQFLRVYASAPAVFTRPRPKPVIERAILL